MLEDHAIRTNYRSWLPEAFQQLYPGIDMREMERMRDYYANTLSAMEYRHHNYFGVAESLIG